jgi:hypothetical protein
MNPDLALVMGIIIAGFSVPSLLSAFSDRRAPRAPALTLLIATALIVYAAKTFPGGYEFSELPEVFARTFRSLMP